MTDPFHEGERRAQGLAGVTEAPFSAGIRDFMPDQHRLFFEGLPYLFAATVDPEGWPSATVLAGAPGFVQSPNPWELRVDAKADDPTGALLVERAPAGLLGLDLSNRRRNRANGRIVHADEAGFSMMVAQSFGNCPQYIQTRRIEPAAAGRGVTEVLDGLDNAAAATVRAADTFFVASRAKGVNGGVDISHRGGRPGFVRTGSDTLTIPDFHGNRFFNTLGNLLVEPRAALLFVDFETGGLLHLRGRADILWDETGGFAGAERLWRFHVEGGWRRTGALPYRWRFDAFAPTTGATGTWTG